MPALPTTIPRTIANSSALTAGMRALTPTDSTAAASARPSPGATRANPLVQEVSFARREASV